MTGTGVAVHAVAAWPDSPVMVTVAAFAIHFEADAVVRVRSDLVEHAFRFPLRSAAVVQVGLFVVCSAVA